MKSKIALLTVSTLIGAGLALAAPAQDQPAPAPAQEQTGQRRQPDPDRQARVLAKRLNLNADQQSQITAILTDRAKQAESIRADNSLSEHDRRVKMQTLRQDFNSKIRGMLTSDQQQTFDQMQQQRRERAHEKGQERENPSQGSSSSK